MALEGTTSSKIDFEPVIKAKFTICSMTQYTGGTKRKILQGKERNWLHGQYEGNTGLAFYDEWQTSNAKNIDQVTNWVVMCGTNAGSQPKLANGVDVGSKPSDGSSVTLQVNQGWSQDQSRDQTSDFAIAEVMVWDRDFTYKDMHGASGYIMPKLADPRLSHHAACSNTSLKSPSCVTNNSLELMMTLGFASR